MLFLKEDHVDFFDAFFELVFDNVSDIVNDGDVLRIGFVHIFKSLAFDALFYFL